MPNSNEDCEELVRLAANGDINEITKLLKDGCNPNIKDDYGWTPLHRAAYDGYADIAKVLLGHGADPNIKNNIGYIPLHEAAFLGYVNVIKSLLEHGADPSIKDNKGTYGRTPLDCAREGKHFDAVNLLESASRGAKPTLQYAPTPQGVSSIDLSKAFNLASTPLTNYTRPNVSGNSFNNQSLGLSNCVFINSGSFFHVYRCLYNGSTIAVKVLNKFIKSFESGELPRFTVEPPELVKEVETVRNLNHPNILKLIDTKHKYGVLIYEFGDGGSLANQGNLSVQDRLLALIHVANGLNYLHNLGLVHGDLKPENVIIINGVCKLGDLASLKVALSALTGSSRSMCTRGFCAPEQIFSDLKDEAKRLGLVNRRDIYQLGNLALALFGIEPIDGEEWGQEAVEEAVVRLNGQVGGLGDLVREMLALKPTQRPSVEEELRKLIELSQRILNQTQERAVPIGEINKEPLEAARKGGGVMTREPPEMSVKRGNVPWPLIGLLYGDEASTYLPLYIALFLAFMVMYVNRSSLWPLAALSLISINSMAAALFPTRWNLPLTIAAALGLLSFCFWSMGAWMGTVVLLVIGYVIYALNSGYNASSVLLHYPLTIAALAVEWLFLKYWVIAYLGFFLTTVVIIDYALFKALNPIYARHRRSMVYVINAAVSLLLALVVLRALIYVSITPLKYLTYFW